MVLRYVFFSFMATIANLATQRIVLWFGNTWVLLVLAIVSGTAIGLFLKYHLDRRWIFQVTDAEIIKHIRIFPLYAAMGIVTTSIFWVTETVFWLLWRTDSMRELGAVIGLSIGYIVKYRLDRRYVFTNSPMAQSS